MTEASIPDSLPGWIKDHVQRYLASDGADGHYWDASLGGGKGMLTTLLLTTRGRKSGRPLILPLIYTRTNGGYCVIASKGGAPQHPAWFLNLQAEPRVEVQVAADKFAAIARVAEGEERERLWQQMVDYYAPYTDYQAATQREIPVVVLDPVD